MTIITHCILIKTFLSVSAVACVKTFTEQIYRQHLKKKKSSHFIWIRENIGRSCWCLILFIKETVCPLQPVDLQRGARWRAAMHWAPAGHWWGSWRTTRTPTGHQWTCQIKVDHPRPWWHELQSPLLHWLQSPHLQLCVVPQRAALNSQVHIIYTCNNLEAQRKGHSEGQTDAVVHILFFWFCLFYWYLFVYQIFLYILKKYMNWWQEVNRQKIK